MRRREFLEMTAAGLVMAGATSHAQAPDSVANAPGLEPFPKIRASMDRIIATTVCTRPFRPQGPRVETERLGRKTIVHNYGHGGSGWSLSWGSSALAVNLALATKAPDIAVIGCGALGLTSALLARRAGLKVTIYAKERPPDVRSTLATGNWSPASRFCTVEHATLELSARWEEMTRISFRIYQSLLGLPGDPVEWRDNYFLSEPLPPIERAAPAEPHYASLTERVRDIMPRAELLPAGTHPFPTPVVQRFSNMIFNISAYQRLLVSDFLRAGGVIETRVFESPSELAKLREKTLINATGYGARALFGDDSLVPVRGQLTRLIPQPEITYGLVYANRWAMLPRRDGIVLQAYESDRYGSEDVTPDRAEADRLITSVADLMRRMP
jgi:glycine/D-amino acid oxidase-like deaminating enzyme